MGIGGSNPIRVQSMTNTRTEDPEVTLSQVEALHREGAELVRVAVQNRRALEGFRRLREMTRVPLVADIHFDYRLAIGAIEAGADKVRINPGNLGGLRRFREVVAAARANWVPLRIGVNSGSLEDELIEKHGGVTTEAMAESALRWLARAEEMGFGDVVISVKGSSVPRTIRAYQLVSGATDAPLHVGITEAGFGLEGAVKSAVGIGALLAMGIGDTIRVSLTGDPTEELKVAWEILKSLEIRARGPIIISCPTCGRTRIDLLALVKRVQEALARETLPIRVAVMGCEVNGPGEAREADVGIAAGPGFGYVFRKGRVVRKVPEGKLLRALLEEIEELKRNAGFGPADEPAEDS